MSNESVPQGASARGLLSILTNLFVAPSEAFAAILKRPSVWAPLLLAMGMNAAFTAVWLQKVDPEAFMKARLDESKQTREMPAEQRAQIVEQQAKAVPIFAWVGPAFVGIILAIVAGALVFVFRFFYAGEVTFKQGFAMTGWVFVAVSLVSLPLILLVLHLKDDWTLDPQAVLQANPSLFVERESVPPFVYSLLGSLDLFSFWMMALLAVGFGLASRRTFGSAIWGVAAPWAIYVLGKAALSGLFG
jgi:hypothetical protein